MTVDFEKAVVGLPDDFICLVVTESDKYKDTNLKIVRYMTEAGHDGAYVTMNEPYDRLVHQLSVAGIDTNKLAFIDAITLEVGGSPDEEVNCLYLDTFANLTHLSIAINRLISQMKGETFLFLDSLSTLLLYNAMGDVARFFHFMSGRMRMWKTKGIFISIKKEDDELLLKQIAPFCDKVIDLS